MTFYQATSVCLGNSSQPLQGWLPAKYWQTLYPLNYLNLLILPMEPFLHPFVLENHNKGSSSPHLFSLCLLTDFGTSMACPLRRPHPWIILIDWLYDRKKDYLFNGNLPLVCWFCHTSIVIKKNLYT